MGLLKRILNRSHRRGIWKPSLDGPLTPPGQRPKGWEVPPKGSGDSDILITKGEADGSHTTIRLPELGIGGRIENKG